MNHQRRQINPPKLLRLTNPTPLYMLDIPQNLQIRRRANSEVERQDDVGGIRERGGDADEVRVGEEVPEAEDEGGLDDGDGEGVEDEGGLDGGAAAGEEEGSVRGRIGKGISGRVEKEFVGEWMGRGRHG